MTKKSIIWVVVIIIIILVSLNSCFEIKKKPTTKDLVIQVKDLAVQILESVGLLQSKVDSLATDIGIIKIDVSELKNRKGPQTIYREIIREVPNSSRQPAEPAYYSAPQQVLQPPQQQVGPRSSEITPGNIAGPDQFKFCIDLEMEKRNDDEKKFLFWELVNNRGYSIPNIVTNGKGPANMILRPGESVDGISYDGSILRISKSSMGRWYSEIFGIPMPPNFRPGIRSDLSGWGYTSKPMQSSGNDFVYRF